MVSGGQEENDMTITERIGAVPRGLALAGRRLRRSPVFALVSGLLLRPLPYRDDGRLMTLWTMLPKFGRESASLPDFNDWKAQGHSFVAMTGATNGSANLTANGSDPERVHMASVLEGFFATLGVKPLVGRDLSSADNRLGSEHVVVISERLWRRRFRGDPGLVGSTILLNGNPYQVVGIVPGGVNIPSQAEVWGPLVFPPGRTQPRRGDFLQVFGRLRPGVTVAQARAEMTTVAGRLAETYPASNRGVGIAVEPLRQTIVGDVAPALLLLTIAVGFVLLIACANIANLLLARATGQHRELAVRVALGASRAQVAGHVLLESLLLSSVGGIAGMVVAWCGVQLLKANAPASMPLVDGVRIDGGVLLFTAALTVCTGLGFGIAPALRASRVSLRNGLSEGAGASSSVRSERIRRALVSAQVALALTLLSGAGLFLQSLIRLQHVDLGFDEHKVLTAQVSLSRVRYPARAQSEAFFRQLSSRIATLPGVTAVGLTTDIPLGAVFNYLTFDVIGRPAPAQNEKAPDAVPTVADSGFFAAMGMVVTRGRLYGDHDDGSAPRVGVVNEEFARRYFNGKSPLGERITFGDPDQAIAIVGVVKTARLEAVGRDAYPQVYTPLSQGSESSLYLVTRTRSRPEAMLPAIRAELKALDPDLPISDVMSMQQRVDESIGQSRLNSTLLSGLSALALVIAALGIYGIVAYGVVRRTREIGVRQALGATGMQVVGLIARQGAWPVILGVLLGLGGSVALGQLSSQLLFSTTPIDPVAFIAATGLLVMVASVACLVPAMRALKVAPSIALRTE